MLSHVPRVLPGTTTINLVLSDIHCFGVCVLGVVPWSCLRSCLGSYLGRALGRTLGRTLGRALVIVLSRCDFLLAVYIAEYGIFTLVCFS